MTSSAGSLRDFLPDNVDWHEEERKIAMLM